MICEICGKEENLNIFEYLKIRKRKSKLLFENNTMNICSECKSNLEILNIKSQIKNIRKLKVKDRHKINKQINGQMNIQDFDL